MITTPQTTRVSARALKSAAVFAGAVGTGSAVGALLAAAYLAGGMAQAASQHARVTRLAAAAQEGFSETALLRSAQAMDPGALAVARRHDPFTVAGDAQRDRQASLIAARLERRAHNARSPDALLVRANYTPAAAAAPFRLSGALDASRDLECLTQAVYYEARGEGPSGQAAVAQVVLNRVRHPAFPKSVCGVVFQGAYGRGTCQFSFACDGSMRKPREAAAWRRAQRVAEKALGGAVMTDVGNATHFHTVRVAPSWGPRLMRVAQVGMHVFYRFGGRAGRPSAFSDAPELSTPEMASEPIYAAPTPGVTLVSAPAADGPQLIRVAATVSEAKGEAVAMGGPLGPAPEPASAPAIARAAIALEGAPKAAAKPATTKPVASADAPIRTAQPPSAPAAKAPAPKPVAEAKPAEAPLKAAAKATSSSAS